MQREASSNEKYATASLVYRFFSKYLVLVHIYKTIAVQQYFWALSPIEKLKTVGIDNL
jgi:cell division septal protein FtsQ